MGKFKNKHDYFMEDLEASSLKVKADLMNADIIMGDDNLEIAGICGSKSLPTDDKSEWDANKAKASVRKWAGGPKKEDVDWNKYEKAFVWVMPDKKEDFTGYKLPFAEVIGGTLKATWGGVHNAMAAVQGARGGPKGVNISKAYNFLESYYEKFEKEPPKKGE